MIIHDRVDYLNKYIKDLIEKGIFPGAAYALATKDELYINSLGNMQVTPETIPVKDDTLFDMASLTKPVATATSILMLIERGMFTLNTRVKDLLPRYKFDGITVRNLLTHTAGYSPEPPFKLDMNADEVRQSVYDAVPDYDKRNREVIYSDTGFLLLGFIIDEITGSYKNFAGEHIFEPLGMMDTCFNPADKNRCAATEFCKMRNRIVRGDVHDEKSFLLGGVAGHAGLFSTASDLGRFAQMILNDGTYGDEIIMNKSSVDLLFKSQTPGMDSNRSIGWAMREQGSTMGDLASDNSIYHTGFVGGSFLIDRDNKKAFVLLTNRVHPTRENLGIIYHRSKINNVALAAIK